MAAEFTVADILALDRIEGEIWREVPGRTQRWVSDLGRYARAPRGRARRLKIDLGVPTSYGYRVAYLRDLKSGKTRAVFLHRLIVEAFLGPIPPFRCCNHIDGNKSNNRLDNLEVVTHRRNTRHAFEIGLHKKRQRALRPGGYSLKYRPSLLPGRRNNGPRKRRRDLCLDRAIARRRRGNGRAFHSHVRGQSTATAGLG